MHTAVVTDRQMTYDGRQLAPHWIYRTFDLLGDAAVAFIGPCHRAGQCLSSTLDTGADIAVGEV